MRIDVERKHLVYGQDEEFVFSFEIAQTLKQFCAPGLNPSQVGPSQLASFFDVPVNVLVELVTMGGQQIPKGQFDGPVPPRQKGFVGVR